MSNVDQEHPQTRENNLHYLNKILKTVASLFWSQTMSMPIFLIESGRVSHPLQENINRCLMRTQNTLKRGKTIYTT